MSFNLKLYLAGTKVKTQDKVETLENPQGYSYATFYHMCYTTGTHNKNKYTVIIQKMSCEIQSKYWRIGFSS